MWKIRLFTLIFKVLTFFYQLLTHFSAGLYAAIFQTLLLTVVLYVIALVKKVSYFAPVNKTLSVPNYLVSFSVIAVDFIVI